MGVIFFIITSFLLGWYILSFFFPYRISDILLKSSFSLLLGNFFLVWIIFLNCLLMPFSLACYAGISFGLLLTVLLFFLSRSYKREYNFNLTDFIIFLLVLTIASFLMFKTITESKGIFYIGIDVWADFELHIPLARSFSMGENFPPESIFFPNKNLSYHFLFDLWAAALETLGLPLASSFNVISILSMTCFLYILYKLPSFLFSIKNRFIGLIPVYLFLFNSSLGFIDAWRKLHPTSIINFLVQVWDNKTYLSVQPFQNDLVSIIWNLNVYVNQRHLLFGLGIAAFVLYLIHEIPHCESKIKYYTFLGILLGLLPFWQTHIFIALNLFIITYLLLQFKIFELMFLLAVELPTSLPQLYFFTKDIQGTFSFHPGFLSGDGFQISDFFSYWFFNLGISAITILIGFFCANREGKKIFIALFSIFVVANLFQFNVEMFNNHKFFNFFITFANIYTALFIYKLFKVRVGKVLFIPILLMLSFSGIIDVMVIKNQPLIPLPDYSHNVFATWVKNNTKKNSIFLTPNDEMYHPIRLVGRKTFGYKPRYAWAYGYDVNKRDKEAISILEADNPTLTKKLLKKESITHIHLLLNSTDMNYINTSYIRNSFRLVYKDTKREVYATK